MKPSDRKPHPNAPPVPREPANTAQGRYEEKLCMQSQLPQLVYTIKEAQKITKLSRTSLWKAVRSGKLKRCLIGSRRVLFTLKALEDFLTQQWEPRRQRS